MSIKNVIGMSFGNNTSVAIVNQYEIIHAMSEERLSNEKNTKYIPLKAFEEAIKILHKLFPEQKQVDVVISHYEVINMREVKYLYDGVEGIEGKDFMSGFHGILNKIAKKYGIYVESVSRVDHHLAHRLPACYMSGFLSDKEVPCISVTADGFGDGRSATIVDNRTNEVLAQVDLGSSLSLVYQFITGCLGFKEHQHEGKITGLAAYGKPTFVSRFVDKLLDYNPSMGKFVKNYKHDYTPKQISMIMQELGIKEYNANIVDFDQFIMLKWAVRRLYLDLVEQYNASRETISASLQEYVEKMMTIWIDDTLKRNGYDKVNLTLSGGFFANVKVNKRIAELECVKEVYVLPPMGDEGTAIGAALQGVINNEGAIALNYFTSADNLYLGYKLKEPINIEQTQALFGEEAEKYEFYTIGKMSTHFIAWLLSEEKIVCLARGNVEFGPRALCNHTILYDASDKGTNNWLNKRLNRTEFMPFAPVTLDKFEKDLYLNTEKSPKSLKYMTIAVDVTEEFKKDYKAAYHVDFTARPQILYKNDNPFVYDIMDSYYKMTGKKALINTSFNLHNYPIVFDEKIAVDSFVKAGLDVLVLDEVLVVKK